MNKKCILCSRYETIEPPFPSIVLRTGKKIKESEGFCHRRDKFVLRNDSCRWFVCWNGFVPFIADNRYRKVITDVMYGGKNG